MPVPEPAPNRDLVQAFLASRDAPCPRCGYNLRGVEDDRCPECGAPLALSLHDDDPRSWWDVLAMIGVVLTALYFGVRTTVQVISLAGGALRGASLASLRAEAAAMGLIELCIAVGGAAWCFIILRNRSRRPRPIWARPTTAASGLLMAVFVAFLLAYGVRALL